MAFSSKILEDTLDTVQHSLANVYEDRYPCSNRVRQGLEGILNQRYSGSQHEFTNKFITPTILLLKRLKEKGFPLMKEGKVIVHLLSPSTRLESGEMLYQVGHTTPGTLALKFTKYQGTSVVLQPSTIEEKELHLAFTQQYIEKMRNEATGVGDQLMRVLLVLTKNDHGDYAAEKKEVKSIMPDSFVDCSGNLCDTPVEETGMPKWCDASDLQHFPAVGNRSDQVMRRSQTGPETGRQPDKFSSGTTINNPAYPPMMQAVLDAPPTPATHHQSDELPSSATPESGSKSAGNPAYPTLIEAITDNPRTTETCIQSQENRQSPSSASANDLELECPPLTQAVKHDSAPPVLGNNLSNIPQEKLDPMQHILRSCKQLQIIHRQQSPDANLKKIIPLQEEAIQHLLLSCKHSNHQSEECLENKSNPTYPPIVQAVRDDPPTSATDHQSQEQTSSEIISNQTYPPLLEAVKDDPSPFEERSSNGCISNPAYPSLTQAVRNNSPTSATGHQSDKNSSNGSRSNPVYPSLTQAVRDDSPTSATGRQSDECSSNGSRSNTAYPPLMQAVRDDSPTSVTGHQSEESSSNGSRSNPAYPPLMQAVRDDSPTSVIGHQSEENSPQGSKSNIYPIYPPLTQAVKDDPLTSATSHHSEKNSSDGSRNNPAYPPVMQAVRDESLTSYRGQQSKESFSNGNRSNPSYPPLMQAVRDDSPTSAIGHQSEETFPNNPSVPTTGHQKEENICSSKVNNPSHLPKIETTAAATGRDFYMLPVDDLDLF